MELTPSPDRRLNRELTMAYDAVALPQRRLYLSWPRNREGSQVRPAAFVEQLMGLLPAVTVEKPEVGSCPPAPLPALDWAGRAGADDLLAALEQTPEWNLRARRVAAAKQYQRGGLTRSAVDAPVRGESTAVRLQDGHHQELPLLLLYAVRSPGQGPQAGRI